MAIGCRGSSPLLGTKIAFLSTPKLIGVYWKGRETGLLAGFFVPELSAWIPYDLGVYLGIYRFDMKKYPYGKDCHPTDFQMRGSQVSRQGLQVVRRARLFLLVTDLSKTTKLHSPGDPPVWHRVCCDMGLNLPR